MKKVIFISVLVHLISCSEKGKEDMETDNPSNSVINGAWELTHIVKNNSDTSIIQNPWHKSIYLFTDKYFSIAAATEERPSAPVVKKGEQIDPAYFKNVYLRYISNSGTYEIIGDSLITNVIVAKSPTVMNEKRRTSQHITLESEKMILVSSKSDVITTLTLKRLTE